MDTSKAAEYEQKLEVFLNMSSEQIIARYFDYRNLLKEIQVFLKAHPTRVPLFPERTHGNDLLAQLFVLQGKNYGAPKKTKEPPWAHKNQETWIPISAKIVSLKIPGERHVEFEYSFVHDGVTVNKTYAFEQDFMHQLTWHWDKQEILENFSPNMEIPCLVSSENPHRHMIWTPY